MKMLRLRTAAMALAFVGLSAGTVATATAGAAAAAALVTPALVQISAEHHAGHDTLVFQFRGGVPAKYSSSPSGGVSER
jgi:hypothetical protein